MRGVSNGSRHGSSGVGAADLFLPGVISYLVVISACVKSVMVAGIGSLELMQQTRVLLCVISYSAVILLVSRFSDVGA